MLERAVRILEVFDSDSVAVSVTHIADRAGLPLSTASRLIDELVEHGLLRRDQQRRGVTARHTRAREGRVSAVSRWHSAKQFPGNVRIGLGNHSLGKHAACP